MGRQDAVFLLDREDAMPSEDELRELYDAATNRLFGAVRKRNGLLMQLDQMIRPLMGTSPLVGLVPEFDSGRARDLLRQVDELAPEMVEAMEEANGYARQLHRLEMRWIKL